MKHEFWHDKWQSNQIGFHESKANSLLLAHIEALDLRANDRVFVPLCGKTLDIGYLLEQGYTVVGAELNRLAVDALFEELGLTPNRTQSGALTRYSAKNIDIFLGDIFELERATLGPIDAVYDRAALIALPEQTRALYSQHLMAITQTSKQLLITLEYDQSLLQGPPFSLSSAELIRHYGDSYAITQLQCSPIADGLKGKCPATESAWLLQPQ